MVFLTRPTIFPFSILYPNEIFALKSPESSLPWPAPNKWSTKIPSSIWFIILSIPTSPSFIIKFDVEGNVLELNDLPAHPLGSQPYSDELLRSNKPEIKFPFSINLFSWLFVPSASKFLEEGL